MFENIMKIFKKIIKRQEVTANSKNTAKERLHLVLMQDRANVSADFLELMKQEIIEVIKKYIDVDENAIDVRLTNKENEDGTNGAPALYANIPILNIKDETRKKERELSQKKEEEKEQDSKQEESELKSKKENKDDSVKKEESSKIEEKELENKNDDKVEEKKEEGKGQEQEQEQGKKTKVKEEKQVEKE